MRALAAWCEHRGSAVAESAADLDALLNTLAGWRGNMV
ncbi:hypothetical protein FB384_003180 [Prauserella sediminis]|uniref:Uncharacterized protein n=1 Tax=Prauserella sediminis TaxID=577680 RepID=A0A839XW75_9PSEU|nr:hypothetical protein [Prauserella sediminis]